MLAITALRGLLTVGSTLRTQAVVIACHVVVLVFLIIVLGKAHAALWRLLLLLLLHEVAVECMIVYVPFVFQYVGSLACAVLEDGQQYVFGVDDIFVQLSCFENTYLEYAVGVVVESHLCVGTQSQVRLFSEVGFEFVLQTFQVHKHLIQDLHGIAIAIAQDSQQQMFRCYCAVVQTVCLFLAIRQHV